VGFSGRGILYSPTPILAKASHGQAPGLTIELTAQATSESHQGIAHILSFYDSAGITFFVGQWKSHLIIRSRISRGIETKKPYKTIEGYREVGLHHVFPPGKTTILAITSHHAGTTVYVDGAAAKHYEGFTLLHETVNPGAHLVLGNAPTGTQQWSGVISGLALYAHLLSARDVLDHSEAWLDRRPYKSGPTGDPLCLYLFNEGTGNVILDHTAQGKNLVMPADFILLQKTFLSLPKADYFTRWSSMQDIAVNAAGFVPLGVLLSLILSRTAGWSRRRTLPVTLLSGLCVSLSIELVQAYIPGRDSSLVDLITNTVGAGAGALVARQKQRSIEQ
jgi:VanZ family protein